MRTIYIIGQTYINMGNSQREVTFEFNFEGCNGVRIGEL